MKKLKLSLCHFCQPAVEINMGVAHMNSVKSKNRFSLFICYAHDF